ncbi:MAG: B12-binding domain-containing radical SAM protein, partial [Bryobacteraceae bacterium]
MKVLIVTGGLLTEKETSLWHAVRKLALQWSAADQAWLDLKVKLVLAEPLLAARLRGFPAVAPVETPELTEVVLSTLLHREGIPFEVATYSDLFTAPRRVERQLAEASCVLASTTYLRDLSEAEPLVARLKRPHNRVVLGGPLAAVLDEVAGADLLAAGYGEYLVPALARWIRSGFTVLEPPAGGSLIGRKMWSGVPPTHDLDALPTPDWTLAERIHGRRFSMIYYESVRGCPYRCNFCNYPYLFADSRFRYKSAVRMAAEWRHYASTLRLDYITCLDSLFTMPRARLHDFCRALIDEGPRVKWICYARADDLADEAIARLMKEAGVHQVQIGLESGDPGQLDNMDKACTVE